MNLLLALDLSILSDEDVFKRMYMKMRPFRKEKIDRIKVRSGKCQSLGAGILLEEALKRAGRSEKEISYKKSGKPYISDDEKIFFNLSHTDGIAVCALSEKEISLIKDDMDATRFWTVKESFMKWTGDGLLLSPEKIEIYLNDGRTYAGIDDEKYGDILKKLFFSTYFTGEYCITVCSEYRDFLPDLEFISINDTLPQNRRHVPIM